MEPPGNLPAGRLSGGCHSSRRHRSGWSWTRRRRSSVARGNQGGRELADDPVAALRSFIEGHLRESLARLTDTIVFVRDLCALSAARAEEVVARQHDHDQELRSLVQQAVDQGRLRSGVTPELAARAVFGMINGVHYWYAADGPLTAEEVVQELATYAMASLAAPHPS